MRNCFANVAIAFSIKRLRPSTVHRAHFSSTRLLRRNHALPSRATASEEQDGTQRKKYRTAGGRRDGAEAVEQVAEENEFSQSKHHATLSPMTPVEPYVNSPSVGNARVRRVQFLFEENYEILSSLAQQHPNETHGDILMLALPHQQKTGGFRAIKLSWTRNFAAVYAKQLHPDVDLNPVVSAIIRMRFVELVRKFRPRWVTRTGDSSSSPTKVTEAPSFLANHEWPLQQAWSGMMVMVMRHIPMMTAQILQASYPSSRPPFYMVAQTLDFIARFGMAMPNQESEIKGAFDTLSPNEMVELILDLVSQTSKGRACVLHDTVVSLLKQLDLQHGYVFYNGLRAFDSHISTRSYLAFADFFATHGAYESALEACEMFIDQGGSGTDRSIRTIAPKLLRRSILSPNGYHDSGYIISRFVGMGIKVGKFVQTALVANAFDSKDTPTAMNIVGLMKEHGRDLDGFAYASMLKGLRTSKDDEMVDDFLGMAWAKVEETEDHFLAGEVLYWYYAQHARKAAATWDKEEKAKIYDEALQQLVSLYSRIYDSTPLEVLGFANIISAEAWSTSTFTPALHPKPFIMNLMVLAYTRARVLASAANSHEAEEESIGAFGTNYRLYERWWLISTRPQLFPSIPEWISKLFKEMMQTPHTFSVFMHALGAQNNTLIHAGKILQRMDVGKFEHKDEDGHSHVTTVPRPDLVAWSTLLNAFARHGQVEAAEKCFVVARRKGVYPDATAWNTLVKVYAVAQDLEGVMRALQRKADAGHASQEDGIARTLMRVKNKAALKELLEKEVRDRELPDEVVLGRVDDAQAAKPKWAPQLDEHVSYQPGAGKRSVMYFDANRTTGLHKEAYTVTEQEVVASSDVAAGSRVLLGQGSFSLKSDEEEDWFEDDDEDKGDGLGWSPMDERSGKDLPGVK